MFLSDIEGFIAIKARLFDFCLKFPAYTEKVLARHHNECFLVKTNQRNSSLKKINC